MSTPRGYGLNGKALYTNIAQPLETWVTFTVAAADTGGLGVTSVKSNGFVEAVFMHTSQTPGKSAGGITNPNPPSGYALIVLKSRMNFWLGKQWTQAVPQTSTSTTSLTANNVYVISSVGTTTQAQWNTAGLSPGFTPAVGQAFVAAATASLSGTGTVGLPGVPTITQVTEVGQGGALVANSNIASNAGARLMLQFAAATNSTTTTLLAAAPAAGTVFSLQLCYDGSSVSIDGL